ncbi:MAG: hypothetical protein H6722_06645 [Sandaracinus sp.]|nr:hypothetical protein [Sandaracinus sp.]MCB9612117.1 hypothetical protein [Sandaracinus sp.]MCB9623477.1 hypothetical protein [Sandaracinus sp.]
MSSFDASRRVRAWPYPTARGGLRLVVDRATADGREMSVDDEHARIETGEAFERLRIEAHVEVDPDVASLVPDPEALALALVYRCAATRVRAAVAASLAKPRFVLELARDDVDGDISLVAQLTRRTQGTSKAHARHVGAWLGSSGTWTLVTRPEPPRDGRFLEIQFQRFSQDPVLSTFGPVLYRLEVDDDEPRLWLNADHTRAAAILSERGTRGVRARLRETIYDRIACGVWTQLFVLAVHARSDETRPGWHDAVLDELLPEVFPDTLRGGLRSRLEAQLEYDGWPGLLARLDLALQRRDAIADHVVKLVAEAIPDATHSGAVEDDEGVAATKGASS